MPASFLLWLSIAAVAHSAVPANLIGKYKIEVLNPQGSVIGTVASWGLHQGLVNGGNPLLIYVGKYEDCRTYDCDFDITPLGNEEYKLEVSNEKGEKGVIAAWSLHQGAVNGGNPLLVYSGLYATCRNYDCNFRIMSLGGGNHTIEVRNALGETGIIAAWDLHFAPKNGGNPLQVHVGNYSTCARNDCTFKITKLTGPSPPPPHLEQPWETASGRACFELWIAEATSCLNAYPGDMEFNGRKPWRFNQYGLLVGRGASSNYAPDDWGKCGGNRYCYMWQLLDYTSGFGPRWPVWQAAAIPPLQNFVSTCLGGSVPAGCAPISPLGRGIGGRWRNDRGVIVEFTREGTGRYIDPAYLREFGFVSGEIGFKLDQKGGGVYEGHVKWRTRGRQDFDWRNGRFTVSGQTMTDSGGTVWRRVQ